jgi:hypothetical protein
MKKLLWLGKEHARVSQFAHLSIRGNEVDCLSGNNELTDVSSALQIRVITHRTFISLAWFLQEVGPSVRVRVKRSHNTLLSYCTTGVWWDKDGILDPFRPAHNAQFTSRDLYHKPALFVPAVDAWL